jgi:hypothetical protein
MKISKTKGIQVLTDRNAENKNYEKRNLLHPHPHSHLPPLSEKRSFAEPFEKVL